MARVLLAAVLALVPAFGAPAGTPNPSRDALGGPVSPQVQAQYDALIASLGNRTLSEADKQLLLAVMNQPELDGGPFKDRAALVRHFARAGLEAAVPPASGLSQSDLWRLVRAARASSEAYGIPPAIVLCLTFRESGFDPHATPWTTTAKGVGQLTNATVSEIISRIQADPQLRNQTQAYARLLGASMPQSVQGAPDVDALTVEIQRLRASHAAADELAAKTAQRRQAIASHKDEPGHIYNLETNFGLASAYLTYLRDRRFSEVPDPERGWLTAVAAYNQGPGPANELVYKVFRGPRDYNQQPIETILDPRTLARLSLTARGREELHGELDSVHRCSSRSAP